MAKLEVDRYGVPQYGGEPELYEEYAERAWDLWFGREGNEQTQAATPIHLRSGLVGTAYAAVRKLDHTSLMTKGTDGKPNDKGLKLLLQTLRDNIEQEAPVKTNELFFVAFYSPSVWRLQSETMQQYIVRREQDFKRLEEVLAGAKIPDHIRAMMLLAFGGLDPREQLNVLSSVNNEYDFKKIAHALRIQYPTCSGKPVHRRDYLGCARQPPPPNAAAKFRPRPFAPKPQKGKGRGYVLAVQDEPDHLDDQDAYVEEEAPDPDDDAYEAHGYSDDEVLESMIQDYEGNADDQELAEAYATILQRRKQQPAGGKGTGQAQSFPFKAKGEVVLDQQAKEHRRNAVKFLKSVTPCSACGKKGRWAGDPECQQAGRRPGKGVSPKKKGSPKKPSASAFFVDNGAALNEDTEEADVFLVTAPVASGAPRLSFGTFDNHFEAKNDDPEAMMTLRVDDLCDHSSYKGGSEKRYMRSANGHSRQIMCKEPECDRAVIQANRKEPARLWAFLVQIALCTLWGRRSRSRALFQRVTEVRAFAEEERNRELDELRGRNAIEDPLARPPLDDGGGSGLWEVVPPTPSQSSLPSSSSAYPVAKIIREEVAGRVWIYGILVAPLVDLPVFPTLAPEDQDILQPLPQDNHIMNMTTPFAGRTYIDVASSAECNWWCSQVLSFVLSNNPMRPEIYAFAFYLHGRLRLVKEALTRMQGAGEDPAKRTLRPHDMVSTRQIRVPVALDPHRLDIVSEHDCDVMMQEPAGDTHLESDTEIPVSYVTSELDPPGLAILDSGCTRTMHGAAWARRFEAELDRLNLSWKAQKRKQLFKGVGGHVESNVVKIYPIALAKVHGEMCSSEAPGPLPLLLSRPFMEELGTVIDMGKGRVSFTTLGVHNLPLQKTSRGHLAVNLLDFDPDALSHEYQPTAEDKALAAGTSVPEYQPTAEDKALAAGTFVPEYQPTAEDKALAAGTLVPDAFPGNSLSQGEIDAILAAYSQDYPEIPEGMNPDDFADYRANLDLWRQDVEEWQQECERQAGGHHNENVSEDVNYFEHAVAADPHVQRRATNRKYKKLEAMSAGVDGDDFHFRRVLAGKNRVTYRPPSGKTWCKQLFAGCVGLSLLCVMAGMAVGSPLDFEISGWRPASSGGRRRFHQDLLAEDPYVLFVRGPLPDARRLLGGDVAALTPKLAQEAEKKEREFTSKAILDRLKAKRHVIYYQVAGQLWLESPEFEQVRRLVETGDLINFELLGGNLLVTSLLTVESAFVQGHHLRAPGSSEDNNLLEAIIQQALVEETIVHNAQEAYPSEFSQRARQPKRQRQGRVSILTEQYAAPPVYIRPGTINPVRPDDQTDRTLAELIGEPTPAEHLRVAADGDDASHRAIMAQLEPALSLTEQERRRHWLDLDPDIRKGLRQLHVQFGHPTNTTLQRILRRQGARPEAIRGVDFISCDACGETMRRRRPRPVRLPGKYEFNAHIQADVLYCKDVRGFLYSFLNVVCDATGFQVVSCMGQSQGPPATRAVLRHFLTSWSSWAGLPTSLQVDRGKEFMAHFADYLKSFGVEQEAMPLEAPWKNGKVERAGGLWKEVFQKTVLEMQLSGLQDMIVAASIVTQTRNAFPRSSGYSPNQWVLGRPEVRLPGSLLLQPEAERLEVLEAAEDPNSAMAKNLGIREAARVAQVRLDTDGRVRRALLHQSTPTRGPYPVGSYVYFHRAQAPAGTTRTYRWHGPARVIGVELRNPRRLADPEPPTDGGQPHSYWLRYGGSVVLVTGEQLRFASEDELLAAHSVPQELLAPPYARGARGYVDLRAQPLEAPPPAGEEEPGPTRRRVTSSVPVGATPSTLVPGTEIAVTPDLLPPVPEGNEGGLLDELGQGNEALPEPPQNLRTGEGVVDGGTVPQQMGDEALPEPAQNLRTGEGVPLDADMHRQQSHMSTEPEPQPTPQLAPAPVALPAPFRDPDRLDGYNPVRARGTSTRTELPYLAEDFAWDEQPLTQTVRELRLKRMTDDGKEEHELDTEEDNDEAFWNLIPADVFLTGKAVRSEIKLKDLRPKERELFVGAMEKEWTSWEKFNAVEVLTPEMVASLPGDVKIIGTRWVHTDKNQKQRLLALHLRHKTGKTKEQIEREYPLTAKSRLVVQGHQEDPKDIRSDSPTASLLGFNLVCAVAVVQGWEVLASDASTAYLQSQGISRLLVLRPPRPPPPGLGPNDLLRAKGSIYGTRDAGRAWWKKLYATLRKHGWRMSSVEAALFILSDGDRLLGVLISHVDDLFSTGDGKAYHATLDEMETELHLTIKRGNFRFCGKNVLQENGEIFIDQMDAIEGIDFMLLPTDRRKAVNSLLTESEKSAFRGLIGQMGWVVRQSRPDLMVNVSIAAQSMGAPRVQDVIRLNKAVKMLKDSSGAKWCFRKGGFPLKEAIVYTFADSSFANLEGSKSQCGFVTGLTSKEIYSGEPTRIYVLEAFSGSIKRVCRSTLAAEANGFLSGAEAAEYLRMLLMELVHPAISIRDLDQHYLKEKVACFTDARSLEQTLNKDAGQPTDKRVRILIAQIREVIGENTFQDDAPGYAVWVDTSQMLADVLTKEGCDRDPLLAALSEGVWQLEPSQAAKEKKLLIQAGRHARKAALRRAEDGCESPTLAEG